VRERIEGMRAASALRYDPLTDQVVLVEQFRIGALGHGRGIDAEQAFVEPFAGGINTPAAIICIQWLAMNPDRRRWDWIGC
jgi:hypothetical protein